MTRAASTSASVNIAATILRAMPTRGEARARATERLRASGATTPALDADVLLAHVLGVTKEALVAHPEVELTADHDERPQATVDTPEPRVPAADHRARRHRRGEPAVPARRGSGAARGRPHIARVRAACRHGRGARWPDARAPRGRRSAARARSRWRGVLRVRSAAIGAHRRAPRAARHGGRPPGPRGSRSRRPAAPMSTPRAALAALRKHALAYPEAKEEFPWGDRTMKVRGKIFV